MFKSLKIGLLMLVLAFVLPTLTFADKAPPPKTISFINVPQRTLNFNINIILQTSAVNTGQVFCYHCTATDNIPQLRETAIVIINTTIAPDKSCNIAAYNNLKCARPLKSLCLNLRQSSGKDKVGWQSSIHSLKVDTTG